jgi:hypothetical protein
LPAESCAKSWTGGSVEPLGLECLGREPTSVPNVGDEIPDVIGWRCHVDVTDSRIRRA